MWEGVPLLCVTRLMSGESSACCVCGGKRAGELVPSVLGGFGLRREFRMASSFLVSIAGILYLANVLSGGQASYES